MTTTLIKPNSGHILTQIGYSGRCRRSCVRPNKSMGCADFPKLMPGDSNTQIRRLRYAAPGET
jgi:hypothetical protein